MDESIHKNREWHSYTPFPIDLLGRSHNVRSGSVPLRTFLEDDKFNNLATAVPIACGQEEDNKLNIQDLAQFPHLLIGGVAGSGKSSFLHTLLLGFFYRNSPADLKLFLVDTQREFEGYHDIPHLAIPIIPSAEKAIAALEWLCKEMICRYTAMSEVKAMDIIGYNRALKERGLAKCPRIVFVVDELWHLMEVDYHLTEELICRIAQLGRAVGIHLVLSSQHMNPDVYTGQVKANICSRIAFCTGSPLASRVVLDCEAAEKLNCPGEMIFTYSYRNSLFKMIAPYVTASEVVSVTAYLRNRYGNDYAEGINEAIDAKLNAPTQNFARVFLRKASLFDDAVRCVTENGSATVSLLQRKLHIGYALAAKIMDEMENEGIVGEFNRNGPRKVLITIEQWNSKRTHTTAEDNKPHILDYTD